MRTATLWSLQTIDQIVLPPKTQSIWQRRQQRPKPPDQQAAVDCDDDDQLNSEDECIDGDYFVDIDYYCGVVVIADGVELGNYCADHWWWWCRPRHRSILVYDLAFGDSS